ncbi:related to putative C2H2 zinc finger protein flbC [Melanopsichium pennsylvanicum]|uniref:Related to putative C2H2 zinc finger protein flbC n=2 Tax=Melanopsichium pennsylvanicum TaxID=63383 RepID=A0AAJ5C2X9_9BASI|nr:related to putative C2H2 zinc finger protein flbC [Melanopsichium pennsylvanicum 4]SNX81884.1 related to putative C2H2 zinc finger protein flbC [Melanopsichium pennsylvanicum]
MGPSSAKAGIPFPGASSASSTSGSVRATSIPRSIPDSVSESGEAAEEYDMEVDTEPAAKRSNHGLEPSTSLPSIKNLFGIERKESLSSVRRADGLSDDGHGTATPSSPAAPHLASSSQPLDHRSLRAHASTSSFSEFQSGLSHSSSSSSLGPIRTRHSSNASGSYGRTAPLVPSTPPRHPGSSMHPFSPEDAGSRRRVDSRSRQAQALKGLILSPPSRRLPLDGEGPASDLQPASQRRSGHRPASSSSGSLSTLFSHISTASDPSPMLPPGYVPSTHTSEESVPHEGWGAASAPSENTSPRTSWHSRSSTLESGEAAYKMMGSDRPSGSLLPPFRESYYPPGEPARYSPEQHFSDLSRHRSMRTPGVSADLPGSAAHPSQRPRARTLTHSDRPIAPLPNSEDPARRQRLEAASELLRMGQQREEDHSAMGSGRMYSHKHSLSMQERAPLSMELYENTNTVRTHRPKSHSMSGQEPYDPQMQMHHGPPGMPAPGLGAPPLDRGGPPPTGPGMFDSFHPRRGRGAGDDAARPGGGGWVFPRRPMPSESAEAQRSAFQAQMMRGQGLPSVPDGIISAQHGGSFGGVRTTPSATGTIASGQAKYECAWCGKRFSRPSSLKIHHHSHTGEKPFVCNERGCGRSFSVQSNLRRHQKCHAPGEDQSEMDATRQQQGHVPSRSDDGYWARGPLPPAAPSSRMSPISGGSGGWHPGYGPGSGPAHGHGHSYGMGPPPPGPMPPQMQIQMQMQMHPKGHPPLSRSAYEPGSRSMNTWTEMRRGEMPPPGYQDYERGPVADHYGISGSPRRFTQKQTRRLEESSGEDEEEKDELLHEEEHQAFKPEHSESYSRDKDVNSAAHGSISGGASSEDEGDTTVTMESGPRPRSTTNASTTSNLRAGFGSLLNPEGNRSDSQVKEEF